MLTFEEIKKLFEFKPDLYQFLNSPLFFLIVAIVLVVFLIIAWWVLRKPKKDKKKLHIRRKEEEPVEECTDYEEPVVPESKVDEKEMIILEANECVILSRNEKFATVIYNNSGIPMIKKLDLSGDEYKELQDRDLTTRRRKPEYIPCSHYIPESEQEPPATERAIPLEKPKDNGIVKKVIRYSPDEVGDVEREVDELLGKKKPKFLSKMAIPRWERTMKIKKKEKETTVEQIIEPTDAKRQLTEKEVFEDNELDDEKPTKQENAVIPPIEEIVMPSKDTQPTPPEGESKRQTVIKLLEQGKSKDEILKTTGYTESTVAKYTTDWTDNQLNIARKLLSDGRWGLVKKIVEILERKETFLVEDGKLYYPGRDKLTYVFLATTFILAIIAIGEGLFVWLS